MGSSNVSILRLRRVVDNIDLNGDQVIDASELEQLRSASTQSPAKVDAADRADRMDRMASAAPNR